MKIVNLTPHDIHIYADGEVVKVFPRSDEVARLATIDLGTWEYVDGVPVEGVEFHHLLKAPPKEEGTRYIVSLPCGLAAPREDFLVPYGEVRDDNGRILGSTMLARLV